MRILLAPDKFKGSLSAAEVAEALQRGFRKVWPASTFDSAPIADGGEGTADVFRHDFAGEEITASAHDALGRPISATYTWLPESRTAVIDMSSASGLWRIAESELSPTVASTFGTGELMRDAIRRGAQKIIVGLGGSATNDGGAGMASALGLQFLDESGNPVAVVPGNFREISEIRAPDTSFPEISGLCDVRNPLLGSQGATAVYGPQKGVTTELQPVMEASLQHLADVCVRGLGADHREHPGAGAAGGLGFGLLTFAGARLEPGFATIARMLKLGERIASADLVVTGEGRLDTQTAHGKGPAALAELARSQGKPVLAFTGCLDDESEVFTACIPIADRPLTLDESRSRASQLLESAAARAARLIQISL
jgi:glycerate kinase